MFYLALYHIEIYIFEIMTTLIMIYQYIRIKSIITRLL